MTTADRQSPPENTLASLLLTLTALSGEFPTSQVSRLPSTGAYREKVLKSLKGEKLLHTYYRDGLRALRLTTTAKKMLLDRWPDWFSSYLIGSTETNMLKSEVPRRLRLHRMAEVLVTMFNAGVVVFPWEKPMLFSPTPPSVTPYIEQSTYFSSREVKELGAQAVKIRGSRSTGILLTDDAITVYNTGPFTMKWEYKAEMRLKALLQTEVCQRRLPGQYQNAVLSAMVFGRDMAQMADLMGVDSDGRHNYFVLDGNFEHFHYLTSDHHGELILQLLCDTEQRAVLDDILSQSLAPCRPNWVVENDAMDGEDPVLFAYTCDMPRIRRFDTALELHGKVGTLFCFDFQKETMQRVCGERVKIQGLDFEKVKALLNNMKL